MPILTNVLGFFDATTLTIASGVVTVTQTMHVIAAESATSDDLDTINISADIPTASGATNFRTYILLRADSGDTITVKHGTGNISLGSAADYVLSGNKTLQLLYTGTAWVDLQSTSAAEDLPNLDANKITSGTLDAARIPNLDASKITSGIMNIAQIPTIPAANVSAGTFPAGAFTFTTSVTSPIITATDTSVATEGANVAVNGTFDSDTAWTKGTGWSIGAGVATKTAGTQSDLSQSVGQAANQVVRVRFDYTRTAGTLSVILGDTTYPVTYSSASGTIDIYIRATNTGVLSFRGDATFAGTIDNVQVNLITARTQALQVPFAGTGNLGLGSGALVNVTSGQHNIANGQQAGFSLTTGTANTINGTQAGYSLTTGYNNNLNGYRAGFSLTTGYYNNLNGYQAGYSLTTGNNNNLNGYRAGFSLTTGYNNNLNGTRAGYSLTTGNSNNLNGYQAGYFETASNLLIFAINDTSTPPIRGIMSGATATITFHSQNVASNVFQVQGIASQTGDLTRWNDSTGANLAKVTANGSAQFVAVEIDGDLNHDGSNVGFYGTAPAAKGTVTGSRGGNAALESLLTALANIGLITDSSTA